MVLKPQEVLGEGLSQLICGILHMHASMTSWHFLYGYRNDNSVLLITPLEGSRISIN